eukprot:355247-Chlamydomonas_euryale.AAC.2
MRRKSEQGKRRFSMIDASWTLSLYLEGHSHRSSHFQSFSAVKESNRPEHVCGRREHPNAGNGRHMNASGIKMQKGFHASKVCAHQLDETGACTAAGALPMFTMHTEVARDSQRALIAPAS